jgi:hypothetical protein
VGDNSLLAGCAGLCLQLWVLGKRADTFRLNTDAVKACGVPGEARKGWYPCQGEATFESVNSWTCSSGTLNVVSDLVLNTTMLAVCRSSCLMN